VIKKYLQFLKLNEGDLFDDENWDDEEEVPPEEEEEMVEDYNGYEISREEAIWCEYDGDWCHQDEVMWSEYEQIHFTPNNHDFVWIDGYAGGDYRHRDDLTFSERDGEHYLMMLCGANMKEILVYMMMLLNVMMVNMLLEKTL